MDVEHVLDEWQLTPEERTKLRGTGPERPVRAAALLHIHAALHVLYSGENATGWVKRPNRRPLFGGRAPLAVMLEGLPQLRRVHRLLDGDIQGVTERQDPDIEARATEIVERAFANLPEDVFPEDR